MTKIKVKELVDILNELKLGLASKEIVEQSTNFVFENDNIFAYNDEIATSYPFKLGINTFSVPGKEIINLLSKLKEEEVELELTEDELLIKQSKTKSGIKLSSEITLPYKDIKIPKDKEWLKLNEKQAKELIDSLSFALNTAATDFISFPALDSVHFTEKYVESCDNLSLSRYTFDNSFSVLIKKYLKDFNKDNEQLLLPAKSIRELINHKITALYFTKDWSHFKDEQGFILSFRIFKSEYPNLDNYLKVDGLEIEFPSGLEDMLNGAEVFSKDAINKTNASVTFIISKNKLLVKSQNEVGWFEGELDIKYKEKKPLQFIVDADSLRYFIKQGEKEKIILGDKSMKWEKDNLIQIIALESIDKEDNEKI